ncbi:MAG: methyltransferase domain-containing protein [Planctomycetales bacterium]|nr:methyltransferase domain-containing protein [Planctomycetales bacterium]
MPQWKLPSGCTPGTRDYSQSAEIAEQYDEYFRDHALLSFDEGFVCEQLEAAGSPGQLVADLGCGTGRALVALAERGFHGLGIDLSAHMLKQLERKARDRDLPIETRLANWVELDGLPDQVADHCVSLFSTLGMIHGAAHREAALRHTRRILKPGGLLILHVHNFWFNLYDAGGPWWVLQSLWRGWTRRNWERGDKYYSYRGVANMFLHVFTPGELRRLLRRAGFSTIQLHPIHPRMDRLLSRKWLAPSLRAIGWMVTAR